MDSLRISRLLWLAAIGAVVAVCASTGLAQPDRPHAVLTQASGDFTIANSLDGRAVFQASGLAPGESVTGTVQLSNPGQLDGELNLAQLDVQDKPGANGGRLSGAVRLDITDVTGGSSVPVFAGQLASVGTRPLGPIGAGQARTFRFTASLADTGTPPSATGGDNAYAGSGLTARYAWTATADDLGGGGGQVAPVVKMKVVTKKLLKKGILDVMASCDKACRVSTYAQLPKAKKRAKKAPKTKARTALIAIPGKSARLRLKISKTSKRQLVKTLRKKRRVVLRVNLSATAASGGPSRAYSKKVSVKRPKPTRRRR
jgi:hypothetical protein